MTHIPSPKFWCPKYQDGLSLEEIEYRSMLAKDAELLVRETPSYKVTENWAALQQRGNL